MKPWDFSAENFSPDDNAEKYIYKNGKIERYLEVGKHEHNFFLSGSKGLGKTLLITFKAYRYWKLLNTIEEREKGGQRIKLNVNDLVESLSFSFSTFSHSDIKRFSEFRIWEQFWRFCLNYIILKKAELPIPIEVSKLVNEDSSLSTICGELIMKRDKLHQILELNNLLRPGITTIKSSVTLFVDRLDHELDDFLFDPEYLKLEGENGQLNPATLMWMNAQLGLISAIFSINSSNKHIKIFATVRSEALLHRPNSLHLNFLNSLTELQYSKEEVKQIFLNNIELMKTRDLVDPNAESPIRKFLGFEKMPHPRARDEHKNRRVEDAFDFIYRHSFGRPREIVFLGKYLFEDELSRSDYRELSEEEKISRVREKVNDLAYTEIFKTYQREVIPRFKEKDFDLFANAISTNVIPREDLEKLDPDIVNYLYSLGLLGYIVPDQKMESGYRQVFLPPAKYNYNKKETIKRAEYYFTHPAVDQKLRERADYNEFYNAFNIIGNGYNFFLPPNKLDITDDSLIPEKYKPKAVMGDRWTKPSDNPNYKHAFPLRAYYISFYNSKDPRVVAWQQQLEVQAVHILNHLGNLLACHLLAKETKSFSYESKLSHFQNGLDKLIDKPKYRGGLKDPFSEKTLALFMHRLTGRMVTLGASLFLDLPCKLISEFLQFLSFDPQAFEDLNPSNSSYKYLQGAFFIQGFSNTCPIGPDDKNMIFHHCSPFEQEILQNWADQFQKEISTASWIISPYDREKVSQLLFGKIWKPVNPT